MSVRSPLYKHLCSPDFETGSYLLKSTKKSLCIQATFRILFGDIGALSLQLQFNGMQVLYITNKLNTEICSYMYLDSMYIFSSENKNLFNNLNSLITMWEPVKANLGKCRFWPAGFYCICKCSCGNEELGRFFNFIFVFYLMKVMAGANSRYHFREGLSFGGYWLWSHFT